MMASIEFRDFSALKSEKFNDGKLSTATTREQINTELSIEKCFDRFQQLQYLNSSSAHLYREQHIRYLENSLRRLPFNYQCLDSSRPWLVYWILNSAHLLNFKFCDELLDNTVDFLIKCRDPNGGFGGGPGQMPHLATTYAAVNSLCIIGTDKAYQAINRETLKQFLWSVRESNGAYRLHYDGETDVRGAYCALSCAKLSNFSKNDEEKLFEGTAKWIKLCQTYEGGFGGAPDLEAHGGYTFCGLAALVMLGSTENCNLEMLLRWAVGRQMRYEGGFQGRTNKLVDGCYSFWVGAVITIAQAVLNKRDNLTDSLKKPVFDRCALQEYILLCCQRPSGGLLDKPGKPPDAYHTCYTLSGLSIAQHCELSIDPLVLGGQQNEVLPTHPIHNIPPMSVMKTYAYFENLNRIYDNDKATDCSDEETGNLTSENLNEHDSESDSNHSDFSTSVTTNLNEEMESVEILS